VNLGVDAKKSDQVVRGSVVLPAGTGKKVRVAVFAQGAKAEEARSAGADTEQERTTVTDTLKLALALRGDWAAAAAGPSSKQAQASAREVQTIFVRRDTPGMRSLLHTRRAGRGTVSDSRHDARHGAATSPAGARDGGSAGERSEGRARSFRVAGGLVADGHELTETAGIVLKRASACRPSGVRKAKRAPWVC
jgi:hypothetical protein